MDVTGNTHRAEFCIDKPIRRIPPLAGWACWSCAPLKCRRTRAHEPGATALLIRALAGVWRTPYRRADLLGHRPARLLYVVHLVQMDFEDVLDELNPAGYAFELAWFAPHFAFRFPRMGELNVRGIHLELRHAPGPRV